MRCTINGRYRCFTGPYRLLIRDILVIVIVLAQHGADAVNITLCYLSSFHVQCLRRPAQYHRVRGNHNARFVFQQTKYAIPYNVPGHVGIQRRQDVVQQIYFLVLINCPSQGHAGFLPSG
uniref:Putative secreted protein n=1 Tax=Anopheles marajoara TaxID=58244 RepID=A0A2M4C7L1_9DIPT